MLANSPLKFNISFFVIYYDIHFILLVHFLDDGVNAP